MGYVYQQAGNYHTATTYYRKAVREQPSHADAWFGLGECSMHLGYTEEAISHLLRAIDQDPDVDDFWLTLADVYISLDRLPEATALLENSLPESAYPYPFFARLCFCYFRTGRRNQLRNLILNESFGIGDYAAHVLSDYPELAADPEVVDLFHNQKQNPANS